MGLIWPPRTRPPHVPSSPSLLRSSPRESSFLFLRFIHLLYFWAVVGLYHCTQASSLVVGSGGSSSLRSVGFPSRRLLLPGVQAPDGLTSAVAARGSQSTGSAAGVQPHSLQGMWDRPGPAITRDQTSVPCFTRRINNHWTTRDAQQVFLKLSLTCRPVKILRRQTRAAAPHPS